MSQNSERVKARYIMIGGFLGAGKTTAVARLAQALTARGLKVGLITNDQGSALVDTAALRARGFATEEIPGGCFCCRFNSLMEAAQRLDTGARPDVFIAEPVGSCTDLAATVTYPLRRIYGDQYSIAPLSVLVDPSRARRIFGLDAGGRFSPKVEYIYRKQLEEADLIVISKKDTIDEERLRELRTALEAEYPARKVLEVSARVGTNLDDWFERLENVESAEGPIMEVDYDLYAEGEALLGWLNATVQLRASEAFDANEVLQRLAGEIQELLPAPDTQIAHLKMTFSPDGAVSGIAAINLVDNDLVPELGMMLDGPVESGQLIVNLRAENAPELLKEAVTTAVAHLKVAAPGLRADLEHIEAFRPGKPMPTHRVTSTASAS